jgi:UDP-N-acetylmuramoyl-tripeptide--D-alanyl-D-alanine ligase
LEYISQIEGLITHIIFISSLGIYLIINLQWYHYKIERVITKHHKVKWHFIYFIFPILVYHFVENFFWIFFYFGFLPTLFLWYRKLDKKLVVTWRVKRFLGLLLFLTMFQDILCSVKESCLQFGVFMPILMTVIGSLMVEKFIFLSFYKQAEKKISNMHNLKVITITGSYGKTSIKNFLAQTLSRKYRVYATQKSVNTLEGIVQDINENLNISTQIYIVEAGAREMGDIEKISELVKHDIAIVGRVGKQHIEYFKTIDNIIKTKLEIIRSDKITNLFLHSSINRERLKTDGVPFKITKFGDDSINAKSTLDGTFFTLKIGAIAEHFYTPVLGKFQSENLEVVIKIALDFGFKIDDIKHSLENLKPVPHRLEKIQAGGKLILDDGYNGNIDGMLEAFRLAEQFKGRKVVITPGLVESSNELNERIAFEIDDIFDVAIITGSLNQDFFKAKLVSTKPTRIFLEDKSKLEDILTKHTRNGDIILFANDAPNFI